MQAVIMAGGEGTRLRPLTSLRPKPMVPIVNQPVMEHIIGLIKHHGITDVVATLAFMPRVIQDYFGEGDEWGMRICYALEESPLGTAGSVKNAEKLLDRETFIVISGDALTDIDLASVVAFHRERGGAVTIALKSVSDPLDFGVVVTAEDGRIDRFLEKPTWGQVLSDTINTGIYVVEPWVLDLIPEGKPFDFSGELFPLLMEAGHALYGCVVEGYWCDVGSRESYMQAHRDVLDGEAMVHVPGVIAREGLWIGEGAKIDPSAELGNHVVIGRNVNVRAGATIGDYTVIADNCVIGTDTRISHSVLWSDTFVGMGAQVAGAVLCRRVDVRARAKIDMGAVIGDETMVGRGAHVGVDVQVYPYKRIEPAAVVSSSLIWESTAARSLFGENGISGLVGVDITPELALKVAQAFGSNLPKGGHVIVSRDVARPSRMVKRAIVAGLNSAGINVRDLRVASSAVNRFTTRETRCVGGIHVCASASDTQSVEIDIFDETGLDLAVSAEKKVERLYFRGEFRRAFFDEVGDIVYPPRALEYYAAGLADAMERQGFEGEWRKVVADMAGGVASIVLPQVMEGWHINLVGLNAYNDAETTLAYVSDHTVGFDTLRHSIELFHADLGVRFDPGAERIRLVTPLGRVLDGDTALHAVVDLWCRTDHTHRPIAVPLQASSVVERIAAQSGREVLRPGRSRRSLATLARDGGVGFAGSTTGGYIFADFLAAYDAVLSLGMIVRMLCAASVSIDDVVEKLPGFYKREAPLFCPIERKSAVMRAVAEAAAGLDADYTEGVRVRFEDGWALVMPHATEPLVTIYAEGGDAESADATIEEWKTLVQEAISV
jgi:mannose-1-phosphate guanylyltransferase/phosphomannomutase